MNTLQIAAMAYEASRSYLNSAGQSSTHWADQTDERRGELQGKAEVVVNNLQMPVEQVFPTHEKQAKTEQIANSIFVTVCREASYFMK